MRLISVRGSSGRKCKCQTTKPTPARSLITCQCRASSHVSAEPHHMSPEVLGTWTLVWPEDEIERDPIGSSNSQPTPTMLCPGRLCWGRSRMLIKAAPC